MEGFTHKEQAEHHKSAAAAHKEQAEHHKSAAAANKEQAQPAVLYSRDTAGRRRVRLAQTVYKVLRVFSSRIVARVGSIYLAGLLLGHRVAWAII